MFTITTRSRASLALATALGLVAGTLSIGVSPASADVVFAEVTDHQSFSPESNKVDSWCAELGGTKVNPGGSSYVLPAGTYSQVIVKAGSGAFANTIFAAPPLAGQTVWADTNGDRLYNPGGQGGDKGISHVILCNGVPDTPATTDLTVDKVWEYRGERPDRFELGNEDAGSLEVTVGGATTGQKWGEPKQGLTVGAWAKVQEGAVPDPADPEGYTCVITGGPTYSVNKGAPAPESTPFQLGATSNTVVVTNTVTCERITEPAKGAVEAVKKWTVTGLDPQTAPGFAPGTPGTLTFNDITKPWSDNTTSYDVTTTVTVEEAGNGTPPTAAGYTCTLDAGATTYTIGQGQPSTTPARVTVVANTTVTVTVTNAAVCTKDIPPPPATTTLTVTKVWAYVGTPTDYPTLTAENAGTLNVTVGGTSTGQAWGATKADLKVGDKANVSEGPVPAPPSVTGYTCEITGSPEYAVNGGGFTTTAASFPLAPTANSVSIRNTVTCVTDDVVGGTEDTDTPTDDGSDDEQAVAGSEDELAATGGKVGPAGLGVLLVLVGAALIATRRVALK